MGDHLGRHHKKNKEAKLVAKLSAFLDGVPFTTNQHYVHTSIYLIINVRVLTPAFRVLTPAY